MVNLHDDNLSVVKQCELIGLAKSSYYYKPVPESELNLRLMRIIDELYLTSPAFGSRQMRATLNANGEHVNRKRVQRLMRIMGLEAMYPKPRTSIADKKQYKYPCLLNGLEISRPNQVWGTDITYIPMEGGFLYLAAVLDLYSRYIVSWSLSDSLESDLCINVLESALKIGCKPNIFHTDQGAQYTSKIHTELLKKNSIAISMSGKGRCWDNIFVERLWRTIKYEEIYLKNYSTGKEAQEELSKYMKFYNDVRTHSSLGYKAPKHVYFGVIQK